MQAVQEKKFLRQRPRLINKIKPKRMPSAVLLGAFLLLGSNRQIERKNEKKLKRNKALQKIDLQVCTLEKQFRFNVKVMKLFLW